MQPIDIHDKKRALARIVERIKENSEIIPENKKTILDFDRHLSVTETNDGIPYSASRRIKLLDQLDRIAQFHNAPFRQWERPDFERLKETIQNRDGRNGNKASPVTVADYGITCRVFWKWLSGEEEETPKALKFWKTSVKKIRILKQNEVYSEQDILQIIEKGCLSSRDRCLVALGFETMARVGELGGLRVSSIKFEGNGNEARVQLFGKTGEREAFIQFSIPFLKTWLADHPHKGKSDFQDRPLFVLFQRKKDYPHMTHRAISKNLEQAIHRSGLAKRFVNPHVVFRKSAATNWANKGASERDLMALGGWKKSQNVSHYIAQRELKTIVNRLSGKEDFKPKNLLEPKTCLICQFQNPPGDLKTCQRCGNPFNVVDALHWKDDNAKLADTLRVQNEMVSVLVSKIEELTKWKDGQDALMRNVFSEHFAKLRGN